jgi:hypothetical protein
MGAAAAAAVAEIDAERATGSGSARHMRSSLPAMLASHASRSRFSTSGLPGSAAAAAVAAAAAASWAGSGAGEGASGVSGHTTIWRSASMTSAAVQLGPVAVQLPAPEGIDPVVISGADPEALVRQVGPWGLVAS